jgi:tRNA threonylcarbamoyladenosine biosynthesis protein TsaB
MIVSLDTSTLTLSLALIDTAGEGRTLEHRFVGPPKRQSEILPGEIESLLSANGKTLKDVTGFVVGLGPGSFTGLRIGLSTIKGLAFALKVPVAGVSSLAALEHEFLPGGEGVFSCAVVKKGELYVRRDAREYSLTVAQLAEELKSAPNAKMIGPALTDYRAPLEALGVPASTFADAPLIPSAVSLAALAKMPATYDAQTMFALEPHYIRGSGAEENPKFPPLPGVEPKARLKED